MGCPTRPSNVRVYQFHHFGTLENAFAAQERDIRKKSMMHPVHSCSFFFAIAALCLNYFKAGFFACTAVSQFAW